jgi:KipI family sensor histidine kinase inhibitor
MSAHPSAADAEIRFEALADDAWLIDLAPGGRAPDAAINACVHSIAARLRRQAPPWLRDLVPAYAALAVFFDDEAIDADDARGWIAARLDRAAPDRTQLDQTQPDPAITQAQTIDIPIVYGGEYGEDLATAAAELGIAASELIARHGAASYTVAMIGFAPGFPYLLGLDPALSLPRLATPRTHVPAGSVAIGGAQTGIYPRASPGGWRLIGRTPLRLFDPTRDPPSLLAPGDRVRFRRIDAMPSSETAADSASATA